MKTYKCVCKVCEKETDKIININFKKVFLCDSCANLISKQQLQYLCELQKEFKEIMKDEEKAKGLQND